MVDFEDAAASATATLKSARLDGDRSADVRLVCRRLSVRLEIVPPHTLRGGHAARYSRVGNRIIRRKGMSDWLDRWWIAHELGHWWVAQSGRHQEDEEGYAHAFAGALLVPAEPLFDRWRSRPDFAAVAAHYPDVSPTCVALRLGESSIAESLVTQGTTTRYTRTRVPPPADAVALGREAARDGTATYPGIAKAWRLTDAARRAVVILETA